MACSSRLRFLLPNSAGKEQIVEAFRKIARMCEENNLSRAVLLTEDRMRATREDLVAALESLSPLCRPGFTLAFVAEDRESFEEFVAVESAGLRLGIKARAFFNEAAAAQWLA